MPNKISCVIITFNEEENIRLLIDEVRQALDGVLDYELIYVDDGSTDSTLDILEDIHSSLVKAHSATIEEYRETRKERHQLLKNILPSWRKV